MLESFIIHKHSFLLGKLTLDKTINLSDAKINFSNDLGINKINTALNYILEHHNF